jgi:hypothetical protein
MSKWKISDWEPTNPRHNTSLLSFRKNEAATKRQRRCRLVAASGGDFEGTGNKAATCCLFVAASVASLLPLENYAEMFSREPGDRKPHS